MLQIHTSARIGTVLCLCKVLKSLKWALPIPMINQKLSTYENSLWLLCKYLSLSTHIWKQVMWLFIHIYWYFKLHYLFLVSCVHLNHLGSTKTNRFYFILSSYLLLLFCELEMFTYISVVVFRLDIKSQVNDYQFQKREYKKRCCWWEKFSLFSLHLHLLKLISILKSFVVN